MNNLKTNFGRQLRKFRRERNWTQEHLAETLNVTVETVSNIERGVNAPSFGAIEKLSLAFDLPAKAFFDFEDEDV